MKIFLSLFVAPIFLAGCVSSEEIRVRELTADRIGCEKAGYVPDTAGMIECIRGSNIRRQIEKDKSDRERREFMNRHNRTSNQHSARSMNQGNMPSSDRRASDRQMRPARPMKCESVVTKSTQPDGTQVTRTRQNCASS